MTWTDLSDDAMAFVIPDNLLIHLESWIASAGGREVSGVGIMEVNAEAKTFTLKKVWLMAAGSVAYTEIPGEQMQKLIKEGVRPDQLKVWWHRHPVGNGIPGPHNWSGTDNNTIREEPFGIDPSMVGWLLSIVRTPRGWVGRYDSHENKQTIHMEVKTGVSQESLEAVAKIIERQVQAETRAAMQKPSGTHGSVPRKSATYVHPGPEKTKKGDGAAAYRRHAVNLQTAHKDQANRKAAVEQLELQHGGFGTDGIHKTSPVEEALQSVGWDRLFYMEVERALRFEAPEFVAFDHSITINEMHAVGLLTQSEVETVLDRIQIKVDMEDPQYLRLIAAWEITDY
jgi:hypothetical protein